MSLIISVILIAVWDMIVYAFMGLHGTAIFGAMFGGGLFIIIIVAMIASGIDNSYRR